MSAIRQFPLTSHERNLIIKSINLRLFSLRSAIGSCAKNGLNMNEHVGKMRREIASIEAIREKLRAKKENQ